MSRQNWQQWLRACSKDPGSPIQLPKLGNSGSSLGMPTGQDTRALAAISACWDLYAGSDADGQAGALDAVRALLPALQPQCHAFARELIAFSLDWFDRERLWDRVVTKGGSVTDPPIEPVGAK